MLGLNIENPTTEQYKTIKLIYDDISQELEFNKVYDIRTIPNEYTLKRGIIESITGGSDLFVSEGQTKKAQTTTGQFQIIDERTFDGWRHEKENEISK